MDADSLTIPKLGAQALKRRLLERVPELGDLAQCEVEVLMNRDSAHVGAPEWLELARRIRARWRGFAASVRGRRFLLHGYLAQRLESA